MEELKSGIREVVFSVLQVENEAINDHEDLVENRNVDFDSLSGFDTLVKLEKKYKIKINDALLPKMRSIDSITEIVMDILKTQSN